MKRLQPVLPVLVISAGLATLLASSLTDEEEGVPPVPVTVQYSVRSDGVPFSRELETREGIVTSMRLAGSYGGANSGDGMSLDRTIVELNTNSSFELEVEPSGDEQLTGTTSITVLSDIDFGLDRNPTRGRFRSDYDATGTGTTTSTFVEVTANGVELLVGEATDVVQLVWSDFKGREGEADTDLNERMASAAYNMIGDVLNAVLVVEDIVRDVENRRGDLEGVGANTNEGVTEMCDNLVDDGGDDPSATLFWTSDASGTGEGEFGINDAFEAVYRNCLVNLDRGRYLDERVEFSDYMPDRGAGLRDLEVRAELQQLFISETVVDVNTRASETSPLYDGVVVLEYFEVAASTF